MSPQEKTSSLKSDSTYYDKVRSDAFNISGHEPARINEKQSLDLIDVCAVRLERLFPACFQEGKWGQVVGITVTTEHFVLGRYARPLLERLGLPDHAELVIGDAIDDGPENYRLYQTSSHENKTMNPDTPP